MKRIQDKLSDLKLYLDELEQISPSSLQEYSANIEKKAACERYVEKIVECILDISFLVIKEKRYAIPEDDLDAFAILLRHDIIERELFEKLRDAKGMRNIIVHQYGKIDDSIIFEAITVHLVKDAQAFIKKMKGV